jgi:hypothetical protein
MKNSSLEITDREYLLKLSKEDFDLSFISQLLKRIEAEQVFFGFKETPSHQGDYILRDRESSLRFDSLDDK